jgi:hypothetical protein
VTTQFAPFLTSVKLATLGVINSKFFSMASRRPIVQNSRTSQMMTAGTTSNSLGSAPKSKYAIKGKNIECSLCLGIFVDPRILSCGHTFCLKCIKGQIASSSIKTSVSCSLCRQVCALPNGDAGKLPKNYSLADVASEATKDTLSFTITASAAGVDPRFLCKTHDQKIVLYCKDCKVLACAVCGLISHSKHTCIESGDADEEFKMKINAAAKKCRETIATHRQKIAQREKELREENLKLENEEVQLANYESLMSNSTLLLEREAAAKSLADVGMLPVVVNRSDVKKSPPKQEMVVKPRQKKRPEWST